MPGFPQRYMVHTTASTSVQVWASSPEEAREKAARKLYDRIAGAKAELANRDAWASVTVEGPSATESGVDEAVA